MDKLKMQSENLVEMNIERIGGMFPNCITEVVEEGKQVKKVDFDLLRQELSSVLVEGKEERYRLDWSGKRQAILTANSPIAKTLRPCREDSVDFDNTENLYIEGDNLDVLKLLHETYLNKIKMIYIDPPYNTGKDFVYKDNFAEDTEEYLVNSNQKDEQGKNLTANKDTSGRYHSDWLSMMYMRLKLARDLLTDDGVVFISIDDNEVHNLRKVCDEIFGEDNEIGVIKILSNPRGRQSSNYFAESGEYLIAFSKASSNVNILGEKSSEEQLATYNKEDSLGKYREMGLRKRGSDSKREDSPTMYFPIYYNEDDNTISLENKDNYIEIIPKLEDGQDGRWRWSKNKILQDVNQLYCRLVKRNGEYVYDVFQKDYMKPESRVKIKDFWIEKEINYDRSSQELRDVFVDKIFDYAKPLYLLKKIINSIVNSNDIILDFFSGSATTAHAVMQLNAEDGGNRKFICVQLPEETDEKSEAFKAGYKNICEIGKERIRRAGKKIAETMNNAKGTMHNGGNNKQATLFDNNDNDCELSIENCELKKHYALDTGFRVLKLDSSNMKEVYYNPSDYHQGMLFGLDSSIKEDRSAEDILFQIMLDKGVLLSSKIEKRTTEVGSQNYYVVGSSDYEIIDLVCCLDEKINAESVKEIAKLKPACCVFLDSGMENDAVRTNIGQIFTTYSPSTKVEVV